MKSMMIHDIFENLINQSKKMKKLKKILNHNINHVGCFIFSKVGKIITKFIHFMQIS